MKIILKNIFIFLIIGLSFYSISSCNDDSVGNNNGTIPPFFNTGILRTDEIGRILGGDYSDWCMHKYVDTFTTAYIINFTALSNTINRIDWRTYKQYHCYGFDIERSVKTDTIYTRCGFVAGAGTTNDTLNYTYYDTVSSNATNYKYRLKVMDIYGNFKYVYITGITHFPLNYSFGPAYPNPVSSIFNINFELPRQDTISIYFINPTDTTYLIKNEVKFGGSYSMSIYNSFNFHKIIKRLYIKCKSLPVSDSCKNYGDIQFD